MKRLLVIACALVVGALIAWLVRPRRERGRDGAASDGVLQTESRTASRETGDTHRLPDVLIDPAIEVEKSSRSLWVLSDGERVKRYRIGLGSDPVGPKRRDRDGRTPEGSYYVSARDESAEHHRAIGISYPNLEDADSARKDESITAREHRQIAAALGRFEPPPARTALGGRIVIHGGGSHRDWTDGSIALDDADIEELFLEIPLGTPVQISP